MHQATKAGRYLVAIWWADGEPVNQSWKTSDYLLRDIDLAYGQFTSTIARVWQRMPGIEGDVFGDFLFGAPCDPPLKTCGPDGKCAEEPCTCDELPAKEDAEVNAWLEKAFASRRWAMVVWRQENDEYCPPRSVVAGFSNRDLDVATGLLGKAVCEIKAKARGGGPDNGEPPPDLPRPEDRRKRFRVMKGG
jgi:hypothetical protein